MSASAASGIANGAGTGSGGGGGGGGGGGVPGGGGVRAFGYDGRNRQLTAGRVSRAERNDPAADGFLDIACTSDVSPFQVVVNRPLQSTSRGGEFSAGLPRTNSFKIVSIAGRDNLSPSSDISDDVLEVEVDSRGPSPRLGMRPYTTANDSPPAGLDGYGGSNPRDFPPYYSVSAGSPSMGSPVVKRAVMSGSAGSLGVAPAVGVGGGGGGGGGAGGSGAAPRGGRRVNAKPSNWTSTGAVPAPPSQGGPGMASGAFSGHRGAGGWVGLSVDTSQVFLT